MCGELTTHLKSVEDAKSQFFFILGQVAPEGNFRFVQGKSDLNSASAKKFSGKLQSLLRTKAVNKTSHHAVSAMQFPAKLPLLNKP